MTNQPIPVNPSPSNGTRKILLVAIVLIVLAVVGFYVIFPSLGIVIALGATAWMLIVATILFFSVAALLFFIIPGIFIFILSLIASVWTVLAIVLFPLLFPIILPVFIILLAIAVIRRRRK